MTGIGIMAAPKVQASNGLNFLYVDTLYWPAGSRPAVIHNLKSMGYKIKGSFWLVNDGFRVEW